MQIKELCLWAANPSALVSFYKDTLGITVASGTETAVQSAEIVIGTTRLRFQQAPEGWRGAYHFAFNIPRNRLSAAKAWLEKQGINLLTNAAGETLFTSASWKAHMIYFCDSAGNIAECIERSEINARAIEGTFSPSELLCISEIGVVSGDVEKMCASLQQSSASEGMVPYKEKSTKSFAALGDAQGLLIFVNTGRPWFPTQDRGAAFAPFTMTLQGQHQESVVHFQQESHAPVIS